MKTSLQYATTLQRDIARTLLYFDIFRHPLRPSEIYRYLPSNSVSLNEIESACSSKPLSTIVVETDGLFCLKGDTLSYIHDRYKKERRAQRMWRIAVLMSHVIRRFPFIRGIFVSGELSKGVASKKADIDFFIITSANRVWITRTLFAVFKRRFLFNRKKLFCYNHIRSQDNLEINERNMYTAIEVATLRPIYNVRLYNEFMRSNSWIKSFLPNSFAMQESLDPVALKGPLSERILRSLFTDRNLDAFDLKLLHRWREIWSHRYDSLNPSERERLFQCERHVSTAYVQDFFPAVTEAYEQRLNQFGLSAIL